jgi:hypothetical protein
MNFVQTAPRILLLMSLGVSVLCGCVFQREKGVATSTLESTPRGTDAETVVAGGPGVIDAPSARKAVLLKIAQDCLAAGYGTFAFTSVGEPKPHLPNRDPDAPPMIASVNTFVQPTGIIPDVEPGTVLGVKFYKTGDPAGADKIFASIIVANLSPK